MGKRTYVLIPGLWDQKFLTGWFYVLVAKWWALHGLPTVVCQMRWVSTEGLEDKKGRLYRCVEGLVRQGRRVVLVGVSAGGPMAIIGLAEHRSVVAAISVCGLLDLSSEERTSHVLTETSWCRAAAEARAISERLHKDRRDRVLTLSGVQDDLLGAQSEHLRGIKSRRYRGKSHVLTVIRILCGSLRSIREFTDVVGP